jgi:hypothetical protein
MYLLKLWRALWRSDASWQRNLTSFEGTYSNLQLHYSPQLFRRKSQLVMLQCTFFKINFDKHSKVTGLLMFLFHGKK